MKMVMIFYSIALNEDIMEALDNLDIKSFSRWERATGAGKGSGPHLANDVWPGENSALAVVLEDDKAKELMGAVRELRKSLAKEGIKAFAWTIEEIT